VCEGFLFIEKEKLWDLQSFFISFFQEIMIRSGPRKTQIAFRRKIKDERPGPGINKALIHSSNSKTRR
jgi:hypothetical protein